MSTLSLKASADRWWTRQALKLRYLYRANRAGVQVISLLVADLLVIQFLGVTASLVVLVAEVIMLMIQHVMDIRGIRKLGDANFRQARTILDQKQQIMALQRAADELAKAADTVWLESRMLRPEQGRRERWI